MSWFNPFTRTQAFTNERTPPSYEAPVSRPVDPNMRDTNGAEDLKFMRGYVAEGTPARTLPPSATDGQPTHPEPSGEDRLEAFIDRRRYNSYPSPGSDTTTNFSGDQPKQAPSLPYGIISGGDR